MDLVYEGRVFCSGGMWRVIFGYGAWVFFSLNSCIIHFVHRYIDSIWEHIWCWRYVYTATAFTSYLNADLPEWLPKSEQCEVRER